MLTLTERFLQMTLIKTIGLEIGAGTGTVNQT